MCSTPSIVTSVPLYLPIRTLSPFLTSSGMTLPSSVVRPLPASMTYGFLGLFLGGVGDDDASPLDFLFFQSFQKNAVVQRLNLHINLLL